MKPESFKLFAELKGMSLHKDDIAFIKRCLGFISYRERRKILERYAEEWLKGMAQTDIVYAKQNFGRKRSNTWLREIVASEGKP